MTAGAETCGAALRRLTAAFAAAGLDTPYLDARLLLAQALAADRLQLLMQRDRVIEPLAAARLAAMAARRLTREPVARIIGERWFYGRPFIVTPATLDPRPDSETLIEAACALMREKGIANASVRALDIGTGTGCLLLTLLSELPGAQGWGTDISADALAVAGDNLISLRTQMSVDEAASGALRHVAWRQGADFEPVRGMTFNLIVSNPPYIPTAEIAGLDPEVRHFDPTLALDGGPDGLELYRRFTAQVIDYLSDGWVIFEVGAGQAAAVADLLRRAFAPVWVEIRVYNDLAGVARCVAASPRRVP